MSNEEFSSFEGCLERTLSNDAICELLANAIMNGVPTEAIKRLIIAFHPPYEALMAGTNEIASPWYIAIRRDLSCLVHFIIGYLDLTEDDIITLGLPISLNCNSEDVFGYFLNHVNPAKVDAVINASDSKLKPWLQPYIHELRVDILKQMMKAASLGNIVNQPEFVRSIISSYAANSIYEEPIAEMKAYEPSTSQLMAEWLVQHVPSGHEGVAEGEAAEGEASEGEASEGEASEDEA